MIRRAILAPFSSFRSPGQAPPAQRGDFSLSRRQQVIRARPHKLLKKNGLHVVPRKHRTPLRGEIAGRNKAGAVALVCRSSTGVPRPLAHWCAKGPLGSMVPGVAAIALMTRRGVISFGRMLLPHPRSRSGFYPLPHGGVHDPETRKIRVAGRRLGAGLRSEDAPGCGEGPGREEADRQEVPDCREVPEAHEGFPGAPPGKSSRRSEPFAVPSGRSSSGTSNRAARGGVTPSR